MSSLHQLPCFLVTCPVPCTRYRYLSYHIEIQQQYTTNTPPSNKPGWMDGWNVAKEKSVSVFFFGGGRGGGRFRLVTPPALLSQTRVVHQPPHRTVLSGNPRMVGSLTLQYCMRDDYSYKSVETSACLNSSGDNRSELFENRIPRMAVFSFFPTDLINACIYKLYLVLSSDYRSFFQPSAERSGLYRRYHFCVGGKVVGFGHFFVGDSGRNRSFYTFAPCSPVFISGDCALCNIMGRYMHV